MQNFGRGMWRRVDYSQKMESSHFNRYSEINYYLDLLEYNKQKRDKKNDIKDVEVFKSSSIKDPVVNK
jgi:hypothetical protein